MKVSILVPIYGVEKYIERCAVSLFEQTYEDIEYIFVNDCTKDNSISVLKGTLERFPNRKSQVKIIEHDCNKGLGAARNTAVTAATGEFLMHVDSDDWVDKDLIKELVEAQMSSNAEIVFSNFQFHFKTYIKDYKRDNQYNTTELVKMMLRFDNASNIWGCLIKKTLYSDNSLKVKEGIDMGEDFQIMPLLVHYAKSIEYVNKVLLHYNCMNVNSYTLKFNASKYRQAWSSRMIISEKIKDVSEYTDSMLIGNLRGIVNALKNCAIEGDRETFEEFSEKLYLQNYSNYYSYIPNTDLFIIKNINNFIICKIYMIVMRTMKRCFDIINCISNEEY